MERASERGEGGREERPTKRVRVREKGVRETGRVKEREKVKGGRE